MPGKTKRWLIMFTVLVLVCGTGWAIYKFLYEEPVTPSQSQTGQVTEFAKPKLVGWLKGKRQWTLEAGSMNDTGSTVTLQNINRGVIYKDGKEYFTFQANQGVWQKAGNGQSGDLNLSGAIKVFKSNNLIFETDTLQWQGSNQMLVAPGQVRFAYNTNTATASQMTFNAVTEDVTLSGEVKFTMDDGTRANVDGNLFYNLKNGTFHIKGNQEFEFNS